jgi:hypothetical protein
MMEEAAHLLVAKRERKGLGSNIPFKDTSPVI